MKLLKHPLKIQTLIDTFGEEATRAYLQQHFKKPESIFQFAQLFTNHINDFPPLFHEELLELLVFHMVVDPTLGTRLAFGAPRGFAKSTMVNLVFNTWMAVNGYSNFTLNISDTFGQAKLLTGSIKAEIEANQVLNFIYPNLQGRVWGEEQIIINSLVGEVLIMPLGAGMKVRGLKFKNARPQLVILDDLENSEAVYSPDRRIKLKNWFDNDLEPALDRYRKRIIFIGTVLHHNSLLNEVLNREGKYSSWITKKFKALQDDMTSLWQSRFPAEYLKSIRDDPTHPDYVGSIVFSQEFQNEPQDDADRIIKSEWIKHYNLRLAFLNAEGETEEEKRVKYILSNFTERVAGVDVAISEKDTADFFAMYIFGFETSTASEKMLDLVHDKIGDINRQVEVIVDKVIEWRLTSLGIESVAYQKGLYNLVRKELQRRGIYTCKVVEIKTDKDKVRRARIHSSAFEGGFVYLRTDTSNSNILEREILEFPLGKHDDAFDGLMLARESRAKPKSRVFGEKPEGF